MKLAKRKRIILYIILSVFYLSVPLIWQVYFMPVYYVVIGLLIGTRLCIETFNWSEKLDERFYLRWKKSQKNGFWINYIWSGLRSLTFIIVIVGFGQLFAYGRTPTDLVDKHRL